MFKKTLVIITLMLLAIACSDGADIDTQTQQNVSADNSTSEQVAEMQEGALVGSDASEVTSEDEEEHATLFNHPCASPHYGEDGAVTAPLDLAKVKKIFEDVKECDPGRDVFNTSGHIRGNQSIFHEVSTGEAQLRSLQSVAYQVNDGVQYFERLPVLERRKILEVMVPIVAEHAVVYLHEDHLHDWLLDLDWSEDIEVVDPAWYLSTDWPEDWGQPVKFATDHGTVEVSKLELWIRMFWLRRGQDIFLLVKEEIRSRMEETESS